MEKVLFFEEPTLINCLKHLHKPRNVLLLVIGCVTQLCGNKKVFPQVAILINKCSQDCSNHPLCILLSKMETCVYVSYSTAHESMLHWNILEVISLESIHRSISSIWKLGDLTAIIKLSKRILMDIFGHRLSWLKRTLYHGVHMRTQIEFQIGAGVLEKHFKGLSIADECIEIF